MSHLTPIHLHRENYSKKEWADMMKIIEEAGIKPVPKVCVNPLSVAISPRYSGSVPAMYVSPTINRVASSVDTDTVLGHALHKALMQTAKTGNYTSWQDRNPKNH